MAATNSLGTGAHASRGSVDWRVVGLLALGSVPGALATIAALAHIPARDPVLAHAITVAIGIALLLAATGFLFPRTLDATALMLRDRTVVSPAATPALTVALGLVLGVIVSFTSVGAGVIGLALLRQLYPRTPMVRLVGSDIANVVPLTLIAGCGHWLIGDVEPARGAAARLDPGHRHRQPRRSLRTGRTASPCPRCLSDGSLGADVSIGAEL